MSTACSLPVPNSTLPFWRTELHELDSHRGSTDLPAETDVVIIGAGFTGAAFAHYLYKDNPSPPSVTILEAREACSGATGRNGGHVRPNVYLKLPGLIKKYGLDAALEAARFEIAQLAAVKDLVETEKIDCEFTLARTCDVMLDEGLAREGQAAFDELVRSGVADLSDVQFITPPKRAERVCGVKGAQACCTFPAAHVWPYKLVMHLLAGAVSRGANLQTHTPVTAITDEPLLVPGSSNSSSSSSSGSNGRRWRVTTPRGTVVANKVLLATNGYTAHVAPQFADHIVPVRGICSHIQVPADRVAPFLPQSYGLRYGPALYDYLIPRNDGSIVVGGARSRFWHDRTHWYGVTDDSKLIEPGAPYFDGLMQRTFIGWENSDAYTNKVWTGIMGYSSDSLPYMGEVPDKPGQFIVAGFSGHGMPLILLSAKGIAQMVKDGTPFEKTGVPALFKATKERLASTKNDIIKGHDAVFTTKL
ncbi:FAD dependent oxidoreductase [Niveomyces insectorum RCEF 264]|uniref:FAD dependent oxidoreductase n=1 Tax=Niveomyces insectorum RCEF 264 TaxID=1081102 RepID=A0A162JCI8_9HYPO|nr:FAD dependent oxidoreductase [Niveomyces insectorum RCEF 264]